MWGHTSAVVQLFTCPSRRCCYLPVSPIHSSDIFKPTLLLTQHSPHQSSLLPLLALRCIAAKHVEQRSVLAMTVTVSHKHGAAAVAVAVP